jgi:asparagine synthase (glutamine-hydrolysing)
MHPDSVDTEPNHSFLAITTPAADGNVIDATNSPNVQTTAWGIAPPRRGHSRASLLCSFARRHEADQSPEQVHRLLSSHDHGGLREVLPTFGAITWGDDNELIATTDALGFRHLYLAQGAKWSGVSTAAYLLASRLDGALDHEALAVQSQLGWQLGQRTLYAGVDKVKPSSMLKSSEGQIRTDVFEDDPAPPTLHIDAAVANASRTLRAYLTGYLDDHPDAILQLTGGLDSRILLSAIPPARRRGLRVLTLRVPGVPDLEIATALSRQFGMHHEVIFLDGLDDLDHCQAYERCITAAAQVDFMSDPLAHASLSFAESRAEAGPRLSGLGGEVARGFYYHGLRQNAPVTRRRARRLAAWRMFTNESVEPGGLDPEFASWARDFAMKDVCRILEESGLPWFPATDLLYLGHRMQRWAGVLSSAVSMDRRVVNPMLDDRFLRIARGLSPQDKRNARFLSRLLLALDRDLAAIPLDGRPAPSTYADQSLLNTAQLVGSDMTKIRRKVVQRVRHVNRPPAGGEILAAKVIEHWQTNPELLGPLRKMNIFDVAWLDAVIERRVIPRSSSVAFMINVLAAQTAVKHISRERQSDHATQGRTSDRPREGVV